MLAAFFHLFWTKCQHKGLLAVAWKLSWLESLMWESGFCLFVCLFIIVFSYSSVQSLSRVWLFASTGTAARHASLSFAVSCSLLKLMAIESVMPSKHRVLWGPLLLPSSSDGDGQEGLACCSPQGCKELDTTERLNDHRLIFSQMFIYEQMNSKRLLFFRKYLFQFKLFFLASSDYIIKRLLLFYFYFIGYWVQAPSVHLTTSQWIPELRCWGKEETFNWGASQPLRWLASTSK